MTFVCVTTDSVALEGKEGEVWGSEVSAAVGHIQYIKGITREAREVFNIKSI